MEIAQWFLSPEDSAANEASRIYIGDETYMGPMLDCECLIKMLHNIRNSNRQVTLVTPFLTEDEMKRICSMIEAVTSRFDGIEVVCNDWGLLQWLTESHAAEPVVGRLLVGQATDPRLAALNCPESQRLHERLIHHADGTAVELRYRQPTDSLVNHLRSFSIAIPDVLTFLNDLGVRRFEISNLLQGIHLTLVHGWDVTLHLPEVLVAIARDHFHDGCKKWLHPSFPVQLYQRDNIIFYNNNEVPANIEELGVNRLVYRSSYIRS